MALKFKLLDVPIAIGADFVVVMLVLGAIWRTPDQLPAWMAVVTGSVLLHELGHAALFDHFGIQSSIRLHGGGGMTIGLRPPPRQHVLISAAGPAMGLIVGGIVWITVLAAPRLATNPIVEDVLWVNLGWSVINLLPFPGVDGAAILGEMTTIVLGRPAEVAVRIIGLVVVGAVCLGLALVGQYEWALIVGWVAVLSTVRLGVLSDVMVGKRQGNSPGHLMLQGLYQQAFDSACVAMANHPGDLELTLVAADSLRLMSRFADAETGYDEILKRDPRHARALRGRAYARRLLGRDAAADADLGALLALPRADAVVSQAIGLYDANRHEDGLRLVLDALPTAENVVVARVLRSFIALFETTLGREEDALRHTDELVSAEPGRPDLHEHRALILCDLGRFDEAVAAARRALAGAPKHPEFLETLSIAERLAGNPFGAISRLVDAAVARPAFPRARAEVALCQLQLGRAVEARAALDTLPGYAARDPFVIYARAALAAAAGATDQAIGLLNDVRRVRPELGVRAQVDPLFRALAAPDASPT